MQDYIYSAIAFVAMAIHLIINSNHSSVKAENTIECVRDYNQRKCPSFFKREFLHQMFNKPA